MILRSGASRAPASRIALACLLFSRRHDDVDVLRSPHSTMQDPPLAFRIVRVHFPPMPLGIQVVEGLFVQVPAMGRVDPAADPFVMRCTEEEQDT